MQLAAINDVFNRLQAEGAARRDTVMGLVVDFSLPRQTAGSDVCVTLHICDSTTQAMGLSSGLCVIAFCTHIHLLPQPAELGDILLLRNVQVQHFRGAPQVMLKMAPNWPHASYQLFHGHPPAQPPQQPQGGPGHVHHQQQQDPLLVPYAHGKWGGAGHPPPLTEAEAATLQHLRGLLRARALAVEDGGTPSLRRICHLAPPAAVAPHQLRPRPPCVDIKAQLLAIDARHAGEVIVLWVWDGTDARPLPNSLALQPSVWKGVELEGPARRWQPPTRRTTTHLPIPAMDAGAPAAPPAAGGAAGAGAGAAGGAADGAAAGAAGEQLDWIILPDMPPEARHSPSGDRDDSSEMYIVPELPALGTLLPVVVPRPSSRTRVVQLPGLGTWAAFKVLGVQVVQGQLQLIMGQGSQISYQFNANTSQQRAVAHAAARQAAGVVVQHLAPRPPAWHLEAATTSSVAAAAAAAAAGELDAAIVDANAVQPGATSAASGSTDGPLSAQQLLPLLLPGSPFCLGRRVAAWAPSAGRHALATLRAVAWAAEQAAAATAAAAAAAGPASGPGAGQGPTAGAWVVGYWRVCVRITRSWPESLTDWVRAVPAGSTAARTAQPPVAGCKRTRQTLEQQELQPQQLSKAAGAEQQQQQAQASVPVQQAPCEGVSSGTAGGSSCSSNYGWAFKLELCDATGCVKAMCFQQAAQQLLGLGPGPLTAPVPECQQVGGSAASSPTPPESTPLLQQLRERWRVLTWVEEGGAGAAWLEGVLMATVKLTPGDRHELFFLLCDALALTEQQQEEERQQQAEARAWMSTQQPGTAAAAAAAAAQPPVAATAAAAAAAGPSRVSGDQQHQVLPHGAAAT